MAVTMSTYGTRNSAHCLNFVYELALAKLQASGYRLDAPAPAVRCNALFINMPLFHAWLQVVAFTTKKFSGEKGH